jgi:hypothetical protein
MFARANALHAPALALAVLLPAAGFAQTDGSARLSVAITDYNGSGAGHWTVAWVTTEAGVFIKTLRKQGTSYGWTSSQWTTHTPQWNAARGGVNGSQVVDGYTSATATTYTGTNSPVILTWNCRDTNNVLVPNGNYKFWVQYAEDSGAGPYTTNGLLWTKGPAAATNTYANKGLYFTNMSVRWTPNTPPPVAPAITSAAPPGGTVGTAYSYNCTVSGTPAPGFYATGLPTGLTIGVSGLIAGTPTTAGTFIGNIIATNGVSPNATQAVSIIISAPAGNTYVGSATCATCHAARYAQFQQSIHSKMIRVGAHLPGVIHGDLRRPNAPTTNQVHWAMGGWSKEENYVRTNWTGSNWSYTVTQFKWDPIAGAYSTNLATRDWVSQCAGCHTTGFNPATRNWAELNVGCESCHGPGGDHVADGGESIFPVIDRSSENCGQCHTRGESVAMGSFTNRQFGFPIGYEAGLPNTLEFLPEPLTSTNYFFPNGTARDHRQQYLDMNHPDHAPTRHHQQGVTCVTCHDPHSAGIVTVAASLPPGTYGIKIFNNPANTTNYVAWDGGHLWNSTTHAAIPQANRSDLCKTCHSTISDHHVHQFNATALAATVSCADCHMPDLINVDPVTLRGALHPHRFAAMKPEEAMRYGPTSQPNSCTYRCHQNKGATVTERAAWADSILTQRLTPLASGVRVVGTPEYQYALQVSSNLTTWISVKTNTATALPNAAPRWGFEYTDPVSGAPQRFYRSKQIVPAP